MADKKQMEASKIDALYSWISYDLQKIKTELLNEMKYSSVQAGSLYREMKSENDKSSAAISQEIRYSYKQNQTIYDGISQMLSTDVAERLQEIKQTITEKLDSFENVDTQALAETVQAKVAEVIPQLEEAVTEVKYTYLQHQAIYDGLTALISSDVIGKLGDVEAKLEALAKIDEALEEINLRVAESVSLYEDNDYKAVIESVAEKTEECVAQHSRQVLEAVAAIPVAENVDYSRIADEVGDKMLEILGEVALQESEPAPAPVAVEVPVAPVEAKIDYDKLIYGTAEKVVESLPYPEKVDYRKINDYFQKAMEKAVVSIDIDALATAVASKIAVPAPQSVEIDYDLLADKVAARLSANQSQAVQTVVSDPVDYERIAAIVEEKLAIEEPIEEETEEEISYNLVLDEEGIQAIAQGVAKELSSCCVSCAPCQTETVEETAQEVTEEVVEETVETVEEPVQEVVEEPVQEVVEEPVQEETVQEVVEEQANEEIAVSAEPEFDELSDGLIDAETGLVIRLKKSFTAKMKQSDESVKGFYSDLKNELTSYKRINSNVSWHGDRFNYGRDTVAKVNICGKTLCFYIALDPEDPELKTTIYHQKNVGNQKAYESTPFMVKIKSDAAAKKALRLIGYLAEKLGTEKDEEFQSVDYLEEFAYASTKQLYEEGFIKVTKEKKVELDF